MKPALRKSSERGQTLVEGTLVMLVFFALLLGIIDFGQVLFAHQSLVERVRASVRWGSMHPEGGVVPVRNMVLYGVPSTPVLPTATFLSLKPENVTVNYIGLDTPKVDVATLKVEIVNFEAPLFAPWWSGTSANHLVSKHPVSASAPVMAAAAH